MTTVRIATVVFALSLVFAGGASAVENEKKGEMPQGGGRIIGRLEVKKTKTRPALTGMLSLGTDGKQIISSTIDNMGNAGLTFGAFTDRASITTIGEGTAMGAKVKMRETLQKKSDRELYHKVEMDLGSGFVLAGEDTCKK